MLHSDFAVVGPGRVGIHLARELTQRGWRCVAIRGNREPGAERRALLPGDTVWDTWEDTRRWQVPPLTFVTVPDRAIEAVAARLKGTIDSGDRVILHTSGLLTAEALAACRVRGAAVASWHPLQSFLRPETRSRETRGVACAVEGDPAAVEAGFAVARALGLRPWSIDPDLKPLYHASAAVAGNLVHILVASAADLISQCGLPDRRALVPLITTNLEMALEHAGCRELTGPLARGDHETVERHLECLPAPLAAVYRALADFMSQRQQSRRMFD